MDAFFKYTTLLAQKFLSVKFASVIWGIESGSELHLLFANATLDYHALDLLTLRSVTTRISESSNDDYILLYNCSGSGKYVIFERDSRSRKAQDLHPTASLNK